MADENTVYLNPWLAMNGVMIPNWLLIREEVSLGAKLVWSVISMEVNGEKPDGTEKDPFYKKGVQWMSQRIGGRGNTPQIKKWINELVEHRLLAVEEDGLRPLNHKWSCGLYTLGPDGKAKYRTHEPGQWWMGRENVTLLDDEDEDT